MGTPGILLANDAPRHSPSRERSPSVEMLSDSDGETEQALAAHEPDLGADAGAGAGSHAQAFHLLVRSERTKDQDISLLVRPTTKCGAIVRAFLKKAGLEAEYPPGGSAPPAKGRGRTRTKVVAANKVPMLSVDGDKMDPEAEIGEADLEDGDMVEVVDL